METFIALLRGVNVGGHGAIAMADLRDFLAALGFVDARSLLQSGNLVFRAKDGPLADLENRLERQAKRRLGLDTSFFVRTADEWKAAVAENPFPAEARRDPAHLVVYFLRDSPQEQSVAALGSAIAGPEVVRARGRHLYAVYPDGIGTSKLTLGLIERKLGTVATGRNWNTVTKLDALADGF